MLNYTAREQLILLLLMPVNHRTNFEYGEIFFKIAPFNCVSLEIGWMDVMRSNNPVNQAIPVPGIQQSYSAVFGFRGR